MKNLSCLLLSLFVYICVQAQVLPPNYQTDWSLAAANTSGITANYDSVSILNFGGDNTGALANDAALSAAIASLNSSTDLKVILFPAGTYLFNATVNLTENVILKGSGADNTTLRFNFGGVGADLIRATGSMGTDSTAIIGSGIKNSYKIRVSDETKFAIGDYIRIIETDSDLMFSTWAYGTLGQFAQVLAVTNDSLTLSSPLRITYPAARNPYIQKVNFVENVGISCMKIVRSDAATTSGQYRNIRFNYTAHSWISGVHSDSTYFAHVDFLNSYKNTLKQSFLENAYEHGGGGRGYGVVCQSSSSECLIINNIFRLLRHSMLLQSGANGNVLSYNYSREPYWVQGFFPNDVAGDAVLHGNYPFSNLFEHNIVQNIVVDNSHAENGPHNLFFRNQADNSGIFMNAGAGDSTAFIGNEVTAAPSLFYGLYALTGNGNFTYGNNVNGTTQPSGTSSLPDNSYYTTAAPEFMTGTWPSIGYANTINTGTIPAETSYAASNFTICDTLAPFIPLAINDINLFVASSDHNAALQWKKINDFPINRFKVLKSYDGLRFTSAAEIEVDINDKVFEWTDYNILPRDVFYQIVGLSNNEICCSSNVAILKPLKNQSSNITVYPNPSKGELNIKLYSESRDLMQLEIIDINGRVILKKKKEVSHGWNEWKVQLDQQCSAILFLRIRTENGYFVRRVLMN